jgi:hypothetical protein
MIHGRFYDQILTFIGAGNVREGVNLLAGMLDAVNVAPQSLAQACSELLEHDLHRLLREDPAIGHAFQHPGQSSDLIELICNPGSQNDLSSTGRRLYSSTSELSFVRALRQRRKMMAQRLHKAWQSGTQICVLEPFLLSDLDNEQGGDFSNITLFVDAPDMLPSLRQKYGPSLRIKQGSVDELMSYAHYEERQFGLICATEIADKRDAKSMKQFLANCNAILSNTGILSMPTLVPQHLGSGWRAACLNWSPHCYEEQKLERMAVSAALNVRIYRDELDCVVWGEFMRSNNHVSGQEAGHGY